MSFFEQQAAAQDQTPPEPPRRHRQPEWISPPRGVLPGVTGERLVLIQTDRVVMTASHFDVYPTGIQFALSLLLKDPDEPHHGTPWELRERPPRGGAVDDDGLLRLGMVYADGRSWSNTNTNYRPYSRPGEEAPTGPHLMSQGGGGGDGEWRMRSWMWPLPPPGDVTFYTEWPAYDVAESSATLDVSGLLEAGKQAETIWSPEA